MCPVRNCAFDIVALIQKKTHRVTLRETELEAQAVLQNRENGQGAGLPNFQPERDRFGVCHGGVWAKRFYDKSPSRFKELSVVLVMPRSYPLRPKRSMCFAESKYGLACRR
jgi:hypothetical protein